MTVTRQYLSVITISVNGLSSQIKRHRLAGQVKKQSPTELAYKKYAQYSKKPIVLKGGEKQFFISRSSCPIFRQSRRQVITKQETKVVTYW